MTTTHTQREAFSNLLRVLETIPDKQFNLRNWMVTHGCNTVGCAIGWCAVDPWFNEHGLSLMQKNIYAGHYGHTKDYYPIYCDQVEHWYAVQQFFDIDLDTADYLFHAALYPEGYTKKYVINRIKEWIATNHPEWSM